PTGAARSVLRRVNCGVVTRFEGAFYDGERSFSGCLFPDLTEALIERNRKQVPDRLPTPVSGARPGRAPLPSWQVNCG
ncbi:MAG TPA: hypothetical protein VGJ13_08735, partial [Pseudonocardiaceae bacterium]